ncbi:MAG: GntR family transcriptional regulator [Oscillospiraceae bacterium]|jgi:GntR family transcriptional regulator|nr:GntR family transcriptional regulator [Oscillospiraceae bacterium]
MEWTLTEDRPIWQQLTEQITLRVLKGTYLPGDKLPAVRELAAQAGVNPNTMQRALAQLEADGLAVGGRTAGRTVTEDRSIIQSARETRARAAVRACLELLAELGYSREDALAFMKEELHDE